jgi:hypothetical protein
MGRAQATLFEKQIVRAADLEPGEALEIRFRVHGPAMVTVIGVGRRPDTASLLEQDYRVELRTGGDAVPVAVKESLRGIVVTSLSHTVETGGAGWSARVCNTAARPQSLSLLVAIG